MVNYQEKNKTGDSQKAKTRVLIDKSHILLMTMPSTSVDEKKQSKAVKRRSVETKIPSASKS
ncbi:MAG: hypothetical protein D6732_19995 [Methanobacteriota archaeon]|nr:MAG: hypothetical protein D6732_19995 [Euryarchaeota archaeon]